jgi:hypothetical protein
MYNCLKTDCRNYNKTLHAHCDHWAGTGADDCKYYSKDDSKPVAEVPCSDGLLLRLLDEMRTETVECLWDHADSEDLDKQTCESMTSRLEDFFNQKIYDIKRKQ